MSFLMVPRAPITTGTVVVLSPHIRSTSISKSLYLVSFSVVLTEVLVSKGIVMLMRREVLSFLFFSTMSGLLAAVALSAWIGMSHRIVTLALSVSVSGSCSCHRSFTYAKLSVDLPVHVCSCLVVAVDVFSFNQFRAAKDLMVKGVVETAPKPAFWVHVSLLEDVVLVPSCWEALILGCDDKALGFSLEASCF